MTNELIFYEVALTSAEKAVPFDGPNILLCVCGSIAAYKAVELLRLLSKGGFNVKVAMTKNAAKFVTPLTFEVLSKDAVMTDPYALGKNGEMAHIQNIEKTDLIVIAPASANMIAKIATGICDDSVSQSVLSVSCPVLIAPAMETQMYENAIIQKRMEELKNLGRYHFCEPENGLLASGREGKGRLAELSDIFDKIKLLSSKGKLKGKRILITAGPTREHLDPIRFLTNASSGKTGYAIARELSRKGADVELVSGPVEQRCDFRVKLHKVSSANDMYLKCKELWPECDAGIFTAAVADVSPDRKSEEKLKKDKLGQSIKLKRTNDILSELGSMKDSKIIIGFAAETEKLLENALKKCQNKNCDLVVANQISSKNPAFGKENNEVVFVNPDGSYDEIEKSSKEKIASILADKLETMLMGN